MIIPTRWRDVKAGDRVVDPAGQVFHVLPRVVPFLAQLRADAPGIQQTHTMPVDPDTYVPLVYDTHTVAVGNLRAQFVITPI